MIGKVNLLLRFFNAKQYFCDSAKYVALIVKVEATDSLKRTTEVKVVCLYIFCWFPQIRFTKRELFV
jgi:hypothetical protein